MHRKLLFILVAAAAMALPQGVFAQQYPSKPVHLVVPAPPGSGNDIVGRMIATRLEAAMGQPFVVDNKAGASGLLAAQAVAQSAPDGYTVLQSAPAPITTFAHLQKLSFDPLKDLAPVTLAVRFALVWVRRPGLEVNSIPELIALQKRKEGEGAKLTVGYSGIGGANHLAILMLNQMAGIQLLPVSYKGETPSLVDLMGGQVDLVVTTLASAAGPLQSGKIGVVATTTAARAKAMPELKTVAESGLPGYEMEGWGGIFVPTGTPREVVQRLNGEIVRILKTDEMRDALVKLGSEPVGNTPEQFGTYIRSQSDRIGKLLKDFDVRAN